MRQIKGKALWDRLTNKQKQNINKHCQSILISNWRQNCFSTPHSRQFVHQSKLTCIIFAGKTHNHIFNSKPFNFTHILRASTWFLAICYFLLPLQMKFEYFQFSVLPLASRRKLCLAISIEVCCCYYSFWFDPMNLFWLMTLSR